MITQKSIPTLEEFLVAPDAQVAAVAPETLIFAVGGTRRAAALAGISPQSDDYARWSRTQMMTCIATFFRLGVRHLFTTAISPNQFAETGRYRERLLDWLNWGLVSPEALDDWQQRKWRVRLMGTETIPELQQTAERLLHDATPEQWTHTLWWYVIATHGAHWTTVLMQTHQTHITTQSEAIQLVYGEDLSPATLYLGFGKPLLSPDILPPLLTGELQCYWTQLPGYTLDERTLRHIFYDYAYLRPTWMRDKTRRYSDIAAQRELWEQPVVLGLGKHIGGFWYPLLDQDEM